MDNIKTWTDLPVEESIRMTEDCLGHFKNVYDNDDEDDVSWRNFLRPEFGTKFQREVPYFRKHPIIITIQSRIAERNPPCRKSARSVQSFRYNAGV